MLFGGYREGERGYFALDVTQPDKTKTVSITNVAGNPDTEIHPKRGSSYVPSCLSDYSSGNCGPNVYPSMLWEFKDDCLDGGATVPCDQDGNGYSDLGDSWSRVNTGRVRVRVDGEVEIRYAAIFGGGMNPEHPNLVGNFLFMVDIETGKALYKRPLEGSVPSEPAAIDSDGDAVLDTIYIGTTRGFMYKADISEPADIDSDTGQVDTLQWVPFKIFDTEDRPIFFAPAVVYVGARGQYALAFGTGDIDQMFEDQDPQGGRFYMVVDDDFIDSDPSLPLAEADFENIAEDADPAARDLLLSPESLQAAGWVLELGENERQVSDPLALSGLLSFSTFDSEKEEDLEQCSVSFEGQGRIYGLVATNGNALGERERATVVDGFAGDAVVVPPSVDSTPDDPFDAEDMLDIRESLMDLFPSNCRFASSGMQIWATLGDSGQQALAEVPLCVVSRNWKDL